MSFVPPSMLSDCSGQGDGVLLLAIVVGVIAVALVTCGAYLAVAWAAKGVWAGPIAAGLTGVLLAVVEFAVSGDAALSCITF